MRRQEAARMRENGRKVKKGELLLYVEHGEYGDGPYEHDLYRATENFNEGAWRAYAYLTSQSIVKLLVERNAIEKVEIDHELQRDV